MLLSQETTTKVTALAQQSDKTDLQNTTCSTPCVPIQPVVDVDAQVLAFLHHINIPCPKKDLVHASILSGHQPFHCSYSYTEADDFSQTTAQIIQ